MNKKLFTGIVFLMGISILGIIIVQLVWMNNAVKVKNELFNRSVNEALINTANKLEDLHNLTVINSMVFHDSMVWRNHNGQSFFRGSSVPPPPPPPMFRYFSDTTQKIHQSGSFDRQNGNNIEVKVFSGGKGNNIQIRKIPATHNNVRIVTGKPINESQIVIVNSDTVITNLDSLYHTGTVRIDSMLTKLDTFNSFLPDFSKRARMKVSRLKSVAGQIVTEIAEWDVRDIDTAQVNQILTRELKNRDIPVKFEYGIMQDSQLICKSLVLADSSKLIATDYKVNLYPNEIFKKDLKLTVWFPGRESYIYRSMNWLLLASFLFSLIILVTFGASIFYILRQKKISEMKSDFINNMTHEFKTPIATISVATDSIINEKVLGNPEKIRYFASMIKKENSRMNRQVEDILTIARLDKKDFEFKWEPIDVHEIINDAVQGIMLQIEKRDGTIKLELNATNPVINTDKIHGTNIFYNLIDNAIKYSVNAPEIKITSENQKNGVMISVEDKGIGMSRAVQARIFERFYRQTTGNIHNVKGFGLGLNYVKAVLEANHGTIDVYSESGKGSRFDVYLPNAAPNGEGT